MRTAPLDVESPPDTVLQPGVVDREDDVSVHAWTLGGAYADGPTAQGEATLTRELPSTARFSPASLFD